MSQQAFDAMYGVGAFAGYQAVWDAIRNNPQLVFSDVRTDQISMYTRWNNGAQFDAAYTFERVHWTKVNGTGRSMYLDVCATVPPYLKTIGVAYMTANPRDEQSRDFLVTNTGFVWEAGRLIWRL